MPEQYKIKVKISLIGDSRVGKTSLVGRYVKDYFGDKYITTIGTKVSTKQLKLKKQGKEINLTLSIWDILGQEQFTKVQTMAFDSSKAAFIVCDLTNKESLENILKWHQRLTEVTGDIPIIILANKCDLTDQYCFGEPELNEYATKLNAPYFITSAKKGDNVIKAFYKIGEDIINYIFQEKK